MHAPVEPTGVLEDVRQLLLLQGQVFDRLVAALDGFGIAELPAPIVHVEAPQVPPEIVIPALDTEAIARTVAEALAPAFNAQATAVGSMGDRLAQIAENTAVKERVSVRGGGTNKTHIINGSGEIIATEELAKQATLAVLAAVDFSTAANQATLLERTSQAVKQFVDGLFRTGGAEVSGINVGSNGSIHLANPADSGVNILITQFSLACSEPATVRYLADATSTGATQAIQMPNRAYEGAVPTKAVLRAGIDVTSGGTLWSNRTRLGANREDRIDYTALVPPGKSMAVRVNAAVTSMTLWANCTWIEVPT